VTVRRGATEGAVYQSFPDAAREARVRSVRESQPLGSELNQLVEMEVVEPREVD
jgi:hypothetical protein